METSSDPTALVLDIVALGALVEQRLDGALGHIKGISLSEYRILRSIADAPAGSASRVELAGSVHLTPSGVTRALKPLEKLGFVETVRDARDARQAKASLTRSGRELVDDAAGVIAESVEALLAKSGTAPTALEAACETIDGLTR